MAGDELEGQNKAFCFDSLQLAYVCALVAASMSAETG